jgi:outer membrane protein assembly factor BamB
MKIFAAIIAALAVGAFQQTSINQSKRTENTAFTKIERIGEANARSFFVFSTERGSNYTIRHDGHAEVIAPKVLRRNFDLKMGLAGRLDRVYFLEYQGDLLLIYETTDGKQTRAFFERMDQKTLKPRWIKAIDGFNLGPALVEGGDAYLVAANLLARVELETGSYLWQTNTEEQNESPNQQFLPPRLTSDHVVFQVDAEQGRTIEVDKATGKILKVLKGKE